NPDLHPPHPIKGGAEAAADDMRFPVGRALGTLVTTLRCYTCCTQCHCVPSLSCGRERQVVGAERGSSWALSAAGGARGRWLVVRPRETAGTVIVFGRSSGVVRPLRSRPLRQPEERRSRRSHA